MKRLDLTEAETELLCKVLALQADEHRWRAFCMEDNAEKFSSLKNRQKFLDMAAEDKACADGMMSLRSKLMQTAPEPESKGTTEQNILAAIKRSGMTIREVAKKAGISENALYLALEGRCRLRLMYFLAICQVLRLDPREAAGQDRARV